MTSNLWQKLQDPEYRKAFVASQINIGIPFQIRALLKSRPGWTQEMLAQRAEMLQPRISGLMTPGRVRPNIETLRRIAEAFDCGLMVRFVPFSELARRSEDFDPEEFGVPSFDNDIGFIERKEPQAAIAGSVPVMPPQGKLAQQNACDPIEGRIKQRANIIVMGQGTRYGSLGGLSPAAMQTDLSQAQTPAAAGGF